MSSTNESNAKVITISATYGAGGSVIAPQVAEQLSLQFYDRLLHAGQPHSADTIAERLTAEERKNQAPTGRLMASLTHLGSGLGLPTSPSDDLDPRRELRRQVEQSVDRAAASGGVILGRAAAVVLAGNPRAFHVRLTGPADRCLRRGMEIEGVTEQQAKEHQADSDRSWSRFVSRLFDRDAADASLYHLVVDTTVLTVPQAVTLVTSAASAFWENTPA